MKSGRFAILLDYAHKTQSKFIMAKIVYDELTATYERELLNRINKFLRAKGSLAAALVQSQLPEISISTDSEVAFYLQHLKNTLGVKDEEIFDYKESYLHDVIERAIRRKRPCTERGEEIRDAVLWHSILDIALESPEKAVIFISHNTKQFTLGDDALHPELVQDCANLGVTVKYFTSLDSFAKQHAINIEFLTKDWLLASINTDEVLEVAYAVIESYAAESLDYKLANSDSFSRYDEVRSPTGYFNPTQGSLEIESYYVYEMTDGSLRVEATFTGEVEVECEVEKVTRKEDYDFEPEFNYSAGAYELLPTTRYRSEVKAEYIYVYPEVSLNLEIIVRDKSVESWKIVGS